MTLHLTAADDPPQPDPLTPLAQSLRDKLCASGTARFFALAWRDFVHYQEWNGPDLMEAIEACGLGEWRVATETDAGDIAVNYEVGDAILCLTEAGRAAIEAAKRAT